MPDSTTASRPRRSRKSSFRSASTPDCPRPGPALTARRTSWPAALPRTPSDGLTDPRRPGRTDGHCGLASGSLSAELADPARVLRGGDVLDLIQLRAQPVDVEAEDAVSELLAVLPLLGHAGLAAGDRAPDLWPRDRADAIVVGDDRVTRADRDTPDDDRHVHRAWRLLD